MQTWGGAYSNPSSGSNQRPWSCDVARLPICVTIYMTFSSPKSIQLDNDSDFMSGPFKNVMKQLNLKHQVLSAYYTKL